MTIFIQHAAAAQTGLPPGSLVAFQATLASGAEWVELDIIPLQGGDFALLHDPDLAKISTGTGKVIEKSAAEIQNLYYLDHEGQPSPLSLGTLSHLISLMIASEGEISLQLDLKPYAPLSPSVLQDLLEIINPVKTRILISSVADWAIRYLRLMDKDIRLGFDPLLYLDIVAAEPRPSGVPPLRIGAYGYYDEHPLAIERWGSLRDYFAVRAEALYVQIPAGTTWFLNAGLLHQSIEAGFDWPAFLHERGSQLDAWTIDMDRIELAGKLVKAGVDMITSNQPHQVMACMQERSPGSQS